MELQELQDRHRKEIEAFRQSAAAGSGPASSSQILMASCAGMNINDYKNKSI